MEPQDWTPPDGATTEANPRYLLQLVLSRESVRENWLVNLTVWTWTDIHAGGQAISTNVYLCPRCFGPTDSGLCLHCFTMTEEPAQRHEGLFVRGDLPYVADHVEQVLAALAYDADLLVIFFPRKLDSPQELYRLTKVPLEDLLQLGEYRHYTRGALAGDSAAGASLNDCIRNFLSA